MKAIIVIIIALVKKTINVDYTALTEEIGT